MAALKYEVFLNPMVIGFERGFFTIPEDVRVTVLGERKLRREAVAALPEILGPLAESKGLRIKMNEHPGSPGAHLFDPADGQVVAIVGIVGIKGRRSA